MKSMKNCIDTEELTDSNGNPRTTSTIDPPSILPPEVEASTKRLKCNKTPGEDNITGGILQDGGDAMMQVLTDLSNTCLHHHQVQKAWKNALIVLINKKGNTSDIKNYRPIGLLPICTRCFEHSPTKDNSHTGFPPTM